MGLIDSDQEGLDSHHELCLSLSTEDFVQLQ